MNRPGCGQALLTDSELAAIRGGMFAPFVNKPFQATHFAQKQPVASPQPPVFQGLGKAMAKGAALGCLAGAATGAVAAGTAGGALLGGMDHCLDRLRLPRPSLAVPANLNIVAQVHPSRYGQVKEM